MRFLPFFERSIFVRKRFFAPLRHARRREHEHLFRARAEEQPRQFVRSGARGENVVDEYGRLSLPDFAGREVKTAAQVFRPFAAGELFLRGRFARLFQCVFRERDARQGGEPFGEQARLVVAGPRSARTVIGTNASMSAPAKSDSRYCSILCAKASARYLPPVLNFLTSRTISPS